MSKGKFIETIEDRPKLSSQNDLKTVLNELMEQDYE